MRPGGVIGSVAFSPDGTRIVTASSDKTAQLWDAKSGVAWPASQTMRHNAAVLSAAFSPDGTRVVTTTARDGAVPGSAFLWDGRSGTRIPDSEPMSHEGAVLWAAYSPDGSRIVTASTDQTARLWAADTGAPLDRAKVMYHAGPVNLPKVGRDC